LFNKLVKVGKFAFYLTSTMGHPWCKCFL